VGQGILAPEGRIVPEPTRRGKTLRALGSGVRPGGGAAARWSDSGIRVSGSGRSPPTRRGKPPRPVADSSTEAYDRACREPSGRHRAGTRAYAGGQPFDWDWAGCHVARPGGRLLGVARPRNRAGRCGTRQRARARRSVPGLRPRRAHGHRRIRAAEARGARPRTRPVRERSTGNDAIFFGIALWGVRPLDARRRPGFPEFARRTGLAELWDRHGPPDACRRVAPLDYRCD
jgi:hypothetical protein